MTNVSSHNNSICMWKFLVYGCDAKPKIRPCSRTDSFWLRRRWTCCHKILRIIMSRPTTPIHGRPRSRSGTRSPSNVADRAVCKIAGKRALLHNFIIILRSWLRWIIYLFTLRWRAEISRSRVSFRTDWPCAWLTVCLLCFCGNFSSVQQWES